jgi:N-acetylmuramoyl-L-alanine amidase
MPAILIECEFLTNPTQLLFLIDSQNQTRLANAIAIGLNEYIFI